MTGTLGSLIVALTVLCSAQPLRTLFDGDGWVWRLAVVLVVVGLTGALARPRLTPAAAVGAQTGAYVVTLVGLFHSDTLLLGLVPTPATLTYWNALLIEAGETLREHAAPAPETLGVTFLLTGAVGAIALVADTLGVTLGRPALAGLPILAPFLAAVANGDGGLPPSSFVGTALGWLALLALHDRDVVRAWGRPATSGRAPAARSASAPPAIDDPPPGSGRQTGGAHSATATPTREPGARRRTLASASLGAAAIAIALLASAALPHLPVRYLADGFGTGGFGGQGQVGFSPSAQMIQDLTSTQGRPVLRYRTDDPTPPPLRVSVSTVYADGRWEPDAVEDAPDDTPQLRYPLGWLEPTPPSPRHRVEVTDNELAAPYLAAPPDVIEGRVSDARWAQSRTSGVLTVDATPPRYGLTYLALDPDVEALRDPGLYSYPRSVSAALDASGVTPLVRRTAVRVTSQMRGSQYDQAVAIQEWLRSSGGFTYSLQLADPPPGMSEQQVRADAVDFFLRTKQGYCVQFATAMVLMARSLDIPARMATGFLPGAEIDGSRRVIAADAHAWPELYFPGTGWLRFEPTPGARSGTPPAYSVASSGQATPATPTAAPTSAAPTASPSPTPSAQRPQERDSDAGAPVPQQTPGRTWPLVVAALLLALAALAAVPLSARRARRRDAARAGLGPAARPSSTGPTPGSGGIDPGDGVEALWTDLVDRLGDVGLAPDPRRTLADQRESIRTDAGLTGAPDQALTRLATLTQAARYAPPGSVDADALAGADADARVVRRAVLRSRGTLPRARAVLLPGAGLRELDATRADLWARLQGTWRRLRSRGSAGGGLRPGGGDGAGRTARDAAGWAADSADRRTGGRGPGGSATDGDAAWRRDDSGRDDSGRDDWGRNGSGRDDSGRDDSGRDDSGRR